MLKQGLLRRNEKPYPTVKKNHRREPQGSEACLIGQGT